MVIVLVLLLNHNKHAYRPGIWEFQGLKGEVFQDPDGNDFGLGSVWPHRSQNYRICSKSWGGVFNSDNDSECRCAVNVSFNYYSNEPGNYGNAINQSGGLAEDPFYPL